MAEMTPTSRKPITTYSGVVTRKSGDKTIRVELNYLTRHPKYGKILRRRTVAHVHDPQNRAQVGDQVRIAKCRPFSKTKTWRLVEVLTDSAGGAQA